MTKGCIEKLEGLRKDERFFALTAEQLIYEAIRGTSYDEVKFLVDTWEEEYK